MSIHRDRHELLSVPIAHDWMRRDLPPIYVEPQLTVIVSEVLHAVLAHNVNERCLTIEAGIVKVADALDMTKGRSRKAISAGKIDIHSISAAAIETVRVTRGTNKPIRIEVDINNPAAVFHLKEVFGQKLSRSSIEEYVEVPKLDELLESLRELSTSEDRQRDAEAAATTERQWPRRRAPRRRASRSASAAARCRRRSPRRVTRARAPRRSRARHDHEHHEHEHRARASRARAPGRRSGG